MKNNIFWKIEINYHEEAYGFKHGKLSSKANKRTRKFLHTKRRQAKRKERIDNFKFEEFNTREDWK